MQEKNKRRISEFPQEKRFQKFWGLVWWSLIRHKILLPTFSIVQVVLSLAVVYGLALLIPNIKHDEAIYLSSGAITICIIAVGCVLASQIISTAKQTGIVQYQKTLPVKRAEIIIADAIIWEVAAIPGIAMSFLASYVRFNITLNITLLSILIILLSQLTMVLIGFSIAYWFSTNTVALVTQMIMIGGLLFSPITYPANRLPGWLSMIHQWLPFVPTGNLIRATFFGSSGFPFFDLFVVISWAVSAFLLSLIALTKRG